MYAEAAQKGQGDGRSTVIDDFTPGYMQRKMHLFPKQGNHAPWYNTQDYSLDKKMIRKADLEDGAMIFGPSSAR